MNILMVKDEKGKEYEYSNIIFEREYMNGKRNGKGKKYNLMVNYYMKVTIYMIIE